MKIHSVIHPFFGHVDDIWITGNETFAELLVLELNALRRLGLAAP